MVRSGGEMKVTPDPTHIGSRLALFGAILYLLEWAFIIPSGVRVPRSGSTAAEIAAAYVTVPASGYSLLFAGLSVVLLGRIAFIAGLRTALRQSNSTRALSDFAFGAMTISVVLEIVSEVLRWTASRMASRGADPLTLVALHQSFQGLTFTVGTALGASILAASLAMLLSHEFSRWLAVFGLVAGALWIGFAFYGALTDSFPGVAGIAWLAWVAWLLTTGVILFRRAGQIRNPATSSFHSK
jgi:hypothetical protein